MSNYRDRSRRKHSRERDNEEIRNKRSRTLSNVSEEEEEQSSAPRGRRAEHHPRENRESNKGERKKPTTEDVDQIVPSKPEIKDVFTKPEALNRNKRLFGVLMGHLGMARSNLEKESETLRRQTEKQKEVAKRDAEETKRLESERVEQLRREKYDRKVRLIEEAFAAWKTQTEPLANFLLTETSPQICWLPGKHNKATKDLLALRQEQVANQIAEKKALMNEKLQAAEDHFNESKNSAEAHLDGDEKEEEDEEEDEKSIAHDDDGSIENGDHENDDTKSVEGKAPSDGGDDDKSESAGK